MGLQLESKKPALKRNAGSPQAWECDYKEVLSEIEKLLEPAPIIDVTINVLLFLSKMFGDN
jgi:hypothetical protein